MLGPGICQALGEAGHGEVRGYCAVNNLGKEPRRNKRERRQQPDVPLDLAFSFCDLGERRGSAVDKILNPSSRPWIAVSNRSRLADKATVGEGESRMPLTLAWAVVGQGTTRFERPLALSLNSCPTRSASAGTRLTSWISIALELIVMRST